MAVELFFVVKLLVFHKKMRFLLFLHPSITSHSTTCPKESEFLAVERLSFYSKNEDHFRFFGIPI